MKTIINKLKKGSILAYTLIVLTIMLMTALSVASVTILDKKNAATTAGSTQAFANADSGSEILLGYRYRDDQQSLNALATSRDNGSCTNGVVTFNVNGGTATLTTYSDTEGTTPITDCSEKLATVQKVKSVGSFSGSSRAVEVAVAVSSCQNGSFKILAKSSNESFTASNRSDIRNYEDQNYIIAGFICRTGQTIGSKLNYTTSTMNASSDTNTTSSGDVVKVSSFTGNPTYLTCSLTGSPTKCNVFVFGNGTYNCGDGWAIIGACPLD